MSIQDFHSTLSSQDESNALFDALRRLRQLKDFRGLLLAEEAGWYPWNDGSELPPPAVVRA
jgi:hypothetical protein